MFFRRVRLTTIGDFYAERFQSRFLAAAYAVFTLALSAFIGGGIGMIVAGKTMVAMTPKAIEACTPAERASIAGSRNCGRSTPQRAQGLTETQAARWDVLKQKDARGELQSFVSHVEPIWFYVLYAVVVGAYTMMGGFRAAAVTDAIQGVLIVVFSVILVPVGLAKLGGFAGLHAAIPAHMFDLFGSATLSDYAWYTILAMVLANLVSIVAVVSGMQTAGSATNEFDARVGHDWRHVHEAHPDALLGARRPHRHRSLRRHAPRPRLDLGRDDARPADAGRHRPDARRRARRQHVHARTRRRCRTRRCSSGISTARSFPTSQTPTTCWSAAS